MNYICLSLLLIISGFLQAQDSINISGDAAFLFAYYPKENQSRAFEEGYKQHLDWHKNINDLLPWYAWYVQTGEQMGMFIDGTFGISFQAFDQRKNPKEDGADFSQTTAPYVDPVYRKVYQVQRYLSTALLLEEQEPSPAIEVFYFTLHMGAVYQFEEVFKALAQKIKKDSELQLKFTFYKLISGDEHPGYLLMIPRENFAYFDHQEAIVTIDEILNDHFPDGKWKNELKNSVKSIQSETWAYRSDLSYFPEK